MNIITTITQFFRSIRDYPVNDIQINIDSVQEPFRSFIQDTIKLANENGVRVVMSKERNLHFREDDEAAVCNGYFCGDTLELAVACGQSFDKWFSVFIHEGCHMDQWLEESPAYFEGKILGVEAYDLLDLWLEHKIELQGEQVDNVLQPSMFVELDCERRVVEKIKKLNLPMDIKHYCRRANSYVYFYLLMKYTRKWYEVGKEPYNIENIVARMPTNLDGDYKEIPEDVKQLMLENLYPEKGE